MRATVVVPTYNEIENIERLIREVLAAAPHVQILVVDDGSPDGTADKAEALGRELGHVSVLRRTEKNGLGNAYRAGLRKAIDDGAEICVQMDADMSHDPAVLAALIGNVEFGADLAIGSRYVPGGRTVDWPRRRRMLSLGQPIRGRGAGSCRQRRHRRVPPTARPGSSRCSSSRCRPTATASRWR